MDKKTKSLLLSLAVSLAFLFLVFNPLLADDQSDSRPGEDKIEKSLEVIKELAEMKDEGIPISLLKKAQGLAILPGVIKAAWALGGQYGSGIAIIKKKTAAGAIHFLSNWLEGVSGCSWAYRKPTLSWFQKSPRGGGNSWKQDYSGRRSQCLRRPDRPQRRGQYRSRNGS